MTRSVAGSCLCGGVRYRVALPFRRAGYCHCSRCRKHSGAGALAQGRVQREALTIETGEELLREFRPSEGLPKVFCSVCGSSLFGGEWPDGPEISVRLGTLDGDPEVRPQDRQYTAYAAPWEPIPADGLPRHEEARPAR